MQKATEFLLKKMKEDKAFAEKVLAQTEKEKVIEIAKNEGIELTLENIDEVNEVLSQAISKQDEGELSEEELENVAGGTCVSLLILGSITATISASFAASAALGSVTVATAVTVSISANEILGF